MPENLNKDEKELVNNALIDLTSMSDIEGDQIPSYCFVEDIAGNLGIAVDAIIAFAKDKGYKLFKLADGKEFSGGILVADKAINIETIKQDYETYYSETPSITSIEAGAEKKEALEENNRSSETKENISKETLEVGDKIETRGFIYPVTKILSKSYSDDKGWLVDFIDDTGHKQHWNQYTNGGDIRHKELKETVCPTYWCVSDGKNPRHSLCFTTEDSAIATAKSNKLYKVVYRYDNGKPIIVWKAEGYAEAYDKVSKKIWCYQFPGEFNRKDILTDLENYDLEAIPDSELDNAEDNTTKDVVIKGTRSNLEAFAEDFGYQLHPDYLCPLDDFGYFYLTEDATVLDTVDSLTTDPVVEPEEVDGDDDKDLPTIEVHATLNPELWKDNKLKPEVKEKLEQIVQKFVDYLEEDGVSINIKDKLIIGSNANYNYNPHSDIDLHIIVDLSDKSEEEQALYMSNYNAYRALFNAKYNISIKGFNTELYVENGDTNTVSNGVYSLNTGWKKEAEPTNVPDDVDVEPEFSELENEYFELVASPTIDALDAFIKKLYALRKESIAEEGEFGKGNLIFKLFRNLEYLSTLKQLKTDLESKALSLENLEEASHTNKTIPVEAMKKWIADKGVTYNVITGKPVIKNTGYVVSTYKTDEQKKADRKKLSKLDLTKEADIIKFTEEFNDQINKAIKGRVPYVGFIIDEGQDYTEIDSNYIISDLPTAKKLGEKNHQNSIWDLEKGETIIIDKDN